MTDALDPLTLPLAGSRLIEASAGTGKTWTIAALVLRLVLGHGGPVARGADAPRPLLPAEILVMTFTRAATRELSDRIRARLLEAARCFRGESRPGDGDDLLDALAAVYPPGPARAAAAWRLALAAERMDDAAVLTLDAWCQRMLREHAFDSGCLFDEELIADERALRAEAAHDYWRQQVYPLGGAALDRVLAVWSGVPALLDDVTRLTNEVLPAAAGQGSLGERIDRHAADHAQALARLKTGWAARASAMRAWLDAQKAAPGGALARLRAADYGRWLAALAAWADDPASLRPDISPTGVARLSPAGLAEPDARGSRPPPQFGEFEQLMRELDRLPTLDAALRAHAAVAVRLRLGELKEQAGRHGFDDMLNRLDRALDPAHAGAGAERLRGRIVAQYPAALIDEFQDTSPLQARILDRIYRIADDDPATVLLLIGDPKQSIYGFRGADLASYLAARRATAGRHHRLGTNRRSTAALVRAVNHLFGHAEARSGAGAFMFRDPAATGTAAADPLPYLAVAAAGRREHFVTSAGAQPALRFELDEVLEDAATGRRLFAARCAERIVALLNDPGAGFTAPGLPRVRLRPADIAVLVRTGNEAGAVRDALGARDVASVYLSDQDSVFHGAEAADLVRWLRAVAAPRDAGLARTALATATLGLAVAELVQLASDDAAFESRSEQLGELHRVWQGQGVLAMLRRTLHLLELPARWLAGPGGGGERRLTNFLHLAELLQAASTQVDGEQGLIRWLRGQIGAAASGSEDQLVRLESDADLVKVVTVHSAKGLEYPLVMLPFPTLFRPADKPRGGYVRVTDAQGGSTLELNPTAAQLADADNDRLRDDLRLLYVALTRARHALWVGLSALKIGPGATCVWHRSAIGRLLLGSAPVPPPMLAGQVAAAVAACPDIALVPAAAAGAIGRTPLRPRGEPAALGAALIYAGEFDRRWTIASYSALVRALPAPALWAASAAAVRDDEVDAVAEPPAPPAVATPAAPWHAFPRGPVAGQFLHDQLEWLAGEGFARAGSAELQQQLLRRCERQGLGSHGPAVLAWLTAAVTTPLPPLDAALAEVGGALPEMEFWLPNAGIAAGVVDALCRRHLLPGRDRPPLPERELAGMLMGYADLVFEHGGRYWVLDYKSNHLGAGDAAYDAPALAGAMAAHRYDVQAALYLLALHRLLRSRLGARYDPAERLGGAVYYFLRGIGGPARGCHFVPPALPLLDALDALLDGRRGGG